MRAWLRLDDDVAAEVDRLRRDEGLGLSEAVNRLIRRGLTPSSSSARYLHESGPLGLRADPSNVADVLDLLDRLEDE
jgi:hypothetical protein